MYIGKKFASELYDKIDDLMLHWHPRRDAADYCCEFCGNTAYTNNGGVKHEADCLGVRFKLSLEKGLR